MRKVLLIFIFSFILNTSFGQRYKTVDIIKKADSLIISIVGHDVFNEHYRFDTSFRIDPVQLKYDKEQKIKHISLNSQTTGPFKYISVDYIFYLKKYEQPTVQTSIILDNNLNLKYSVDTSFIPQFILKNTKDTFLSKEQVLYIAKSKFKKSGQYIESRIYYDAQRKGYVWEITNVLKQFSGGSRSVELMTMDPLTGEIGEIFDGIKGQLH